MQSPDEVELVHLLLSRLERISVDSYWAHRASGVRGALLKILDEGNTIPDHQAHVDELITASFKILTLAAKDKKRGSGNSDRFSR
jgi:hypothetical protein